MPETIASVPSPSGSALKLTQIKKRFGGIIALDGVDLALERGEIHGLVGENGAGKSTLIKTLCGIVHRDSGTMTLGGQPYEPSGPREAKRAGVQVVHQEFNLMPHLTVAENVCFEHLPRQWGVFLDRDEMNARARKALDAVGLSEVPVTANVQSLGIALRQLVEIARALMSDSSILVLDEPTATLTSHEAQRLFQLVHELADKGVAVLLVTHHLNEIMDHCDRITVMRNGVSVETMPIAEASTERLIQSMVGRRLAGELASDHPSFATDKVMLSVRGLVHTSSKNSKGVSLDLHKGEILGIGGLVGAGRTEFLRALFGIESASSGSILRNGRTTPYSKPSEAIKDGIAFVTEDRKDEGLILRMPIAANICLADMRKVSSRGLLSRSRETSLAKKLGAKLALKYGGPQDAVSTLSGGNQQKVVLAKWLSRDPKILILDEPTRGVDVGAKAEIYALLRDFAAEGRGLIVVSSEINELMALCDRILVMANHRITGELKRPEFSEENILRLAYQFGDDSQTGVH
ncbi:sugar ABC transporter ATP-binding protein [Cereibacter sp. SYSU M97828]|nr:sugar ABC transporter ATP-binding protein [Cereibacter flavus]